MGEPREDEPFCESFPKNIISRILLKNCSILPSSFAYLPPNSACASHTGCVSEDGDASESQNGGEFIRSSALIIFYDLVSSISAVAI